MLKMCSKCKKPKLLGAFTKNKARKDGLNHSCRECHRKYVRGHYRANRAYYKAKAKQRRGEEQPEMRRIIREAKDRPCVDCGRSFPHYVMDFDHIRGTKKYNIAHLATRGGTVSALLREIAKCEVVCANCHRERTFGPVALRSSIG